MGKPLDVVGNRYGKLVVLGNAEHRRSPNGQSMRFVTCKCDCGNITEIRISAITSGNTKSCGCLKGKNQKGKKHKGKHNMCNTRLYECWRGMKQRCNYNRHPSYENYGGRGIKICNEWLHDFNAFYEWAISHGYSDDLTLDRIDVDGNYCPENCRWVDKSTQSANRRTIGKTGYIGVFPCDSGKSFFTSITRKGKMIFRYSSKSKNDCARKRNEYIIQHNLDYPLNNISDDMEVIRL